MSNHDAFFPVSQEIFGEHADELSHALHITCASIAARRAGAKESGACDGTSVMAESEDHEHDNVQGLIWHIRNTVPSTYDHMTYESTFMCAPIWT